MFVGSCIVQIMQEIKHQGLGQMTGLCALLRNSGTGGKHPQNIKRDMLRTLAKKKQDPSVPRSHNTILNSNEIFPSVVVETLELANWFCLRMHSCNGFVRCQSIMFQFRYMSLVLMVIGTSKKGRALTVQLVVLEKRNLSCAVKTFDAPMK